MVQNIVKNNTKIYYILQFCHSLMFTAPIWIVYYKLNNVGLAEISLIITLSYVMQMLWELPSGALADLLGRKNIILIAFVIAIIAFLLFPFIEGFVAFLCVHLLISISDSFRSGSEEALIYDSYKEGKQEDKIDQVYVMGNNVYQAGLISGAILGGYIYQINNELPFILYAISLIIGLIAGFFLIEPTIDSEKFSFRNYLIQIKNGAQEVFRTQYTKTISLYYIFVGGIAWSSTLFFNESLMIHLGYTDDFRGLISGFLRLLNILLLMYLAKRLAKFPKHYILIAFPIVMLVAYLPGFALQGNFALPFIQLAMIATTARWAILSPIVNREFNSKYRATAISFLSLMIGFVYIAMTGISAYVIPQFGTGVMYSILGISTFLIVVPTTYALLRAKK